MIRWRHWLCSILKLVFDANFWVGGAIAAVEGEPTPRTPISGAAELLGDEEWVRTLAGGLPVRPADRVGKSDLNYNEKFTYNLALLKRTAVM